MGPGIDVLLIDDDRLDVKTVQRAFRVARVEGQLSTAGSGESALRGLRSQRFRPQLILLDLNMPAMNGLEFLQEIKRDQKLRVIPVVVLTTSFVAVKAMTRCGVATAQTCFSSSASTAQAVMRLAVLRIPTSSTIWISPKATSSRSVITGSRSRMTMA